MRCVVQRVSRAEVRIADEAVARIGRGLLVLAAVERGDREQEVVAAARKISELRIFGDDAGKMNLALKDVAGSVLAVSQFTLAGSIARGRRPSFDGAEEPGRANLLFEAFVAGIRECGIPVETGVFGGMMEVELVNDGPVTFVLETRNPSGRAPA